MKKIVMTGGGTAGHVTPNIAIINELKDKYDIHYIGSKNSVEEDLVKKENIKFYGISSGKLRRSLNFKNFTDIFRVLKGISESVFLLRKIKPDLIFSKGGYVTVPVILASKTTKIPVIIHESDFTIGLANKISIPIAKKVCVTFEKTIKQIGKDKCIYTGPPVRKSIFLGNKNLGKKFCNFPSNKPVIIFIGGSQGSENINKLVRENIKKLNNFNIVHICGKGNLDVNLNYDNYLQFEYLNDQLPDVFAFADLIVSRAGSNTIYEILALKKLNLLIPLSKKASRGDQLDNAKEFEQKGYSKVLQEDEKINDLFVPTILELYENRNKYIKKMVHCNFVNGTAKIIDIIQNELK